MRIIICFCAVVIMPAVLLLPSCQGKLSQEERQAMREAQEDRAIRRVTDQEIMQAALEAGRMIRNEYESGSGKDSLARAYGATIQYHTDSLQMEDLEREVWQAYQAGLESGADLGENVQRDYPDYLYYSYPDTENDSLRGMVSIRISRKALIVNQ